jgi:hypothetical protein
MRVIEVLAQHAGSRADHAPLVNGRCAVTRAQALLRSKAVPFVMNRVAPEAMAW